MRFFFDAFDRIGMSQRRAERRIRPSEVAEVRWPPRKLSRWPHQILAVARAWHSQVLWIAAIGEILRIAGVDAPRHSHALPWLRPSARIELRQCDPCFRPCS